MIEYIAQQPLVEDQPHIVAAVLPAAGAYTANPAQQIPHGSDDLSIVFAYAKGLAAATGAFKAQVWWYLQGEEDQPVQHCFLDAAGATIGADTAIVGAYQEELQFEPLAVAGTIRRMVVVRVPAGAVQVRVVAAETGEVGQPGTLGCRLVARKRFC